MPKQPKDKNIPFTMEKYLQLAYAKGAVRPITIFEGCYQITALEICIKVDINEDRLRGCVVIKLAGREVLDGCTSATSQDEVATVIIESGTLNVGFWKLEKPELTITHHFIDNSGDCKLWSRLYKLEGLPIPDYEIKEEWNHDVIFKW